MGPVTQRRFWLPLARLGAFFVAVVVLGSALLLATYSPVEGESARESGRRDFLGRKKRQLQRHWRKIRTFFETSTGTGVPTSSLPGEIVFLAAPPPGGILAAPQQGEILAVADAPAVPPLTLQTEDLPLAFTWPKAPILPVRTVDLPRAVSEPEYDLLTPELVEELYATHRPDWFLDAGDSLLKGPEYVFDGIVMCASGMVPRADVYSWRAGDDAGIAARMLDFTVESRQGRIFTEFAGHLLDEEVEFWMDFGESHLNTPAFEEGREELDGDALVQEQGKVLWDAFRKTYFSKYKFRAEKAVRDDAFRFRGWRGIDYVLLPPLMGGYVYYRGVEKKFSVAGTRLEVNLEPAYKWADRDDLVAGLSVMWRPRKRFPVGVIVSAGLYGGDVELDFIGIGTSLQMGRRALYLRQDER